MKHIGIIDYFKVKRSIARSNSDCWYYAINVNEIDVFTVKFSNIKLFFFFL